MKKTEIVLLVLMSLLTLFACHSAGSRPHSPAPAASPALDHDNSAAIVGIVGQM